MGGSSGKTQTTKTEPWAGQQPFLSDIYSRAQQWSQDPARRQPQYPPFSTVAPLSGLEQQGRQNLLGFMGGGIPQNVTEQLLRSGQAGLNQQQGQQYQMLAGGVPYAQQALRGAAAGQQAPQFQAPGAQFSDVNLPGMQGIMGLANVPSYQEIMGAAQQGQVPGTQQTIQSMMSGTPDMSVWGPLMAEAQRLPIQAFQEEVLPRLRQEAQGAGQLGGSRAAMATGLAAGRLGESLAGQQTQLASEAARQAQSQQQAGLQGAIQQGQLGLGMGQLGIGAGQLGLGLGGLGLDVGGQQLQRAGMETQRAGTMGQMDLQAQQMGEQARQANLMAQLQAAGQLGGQFQDMYNTAQQTGLGYAGLLPQALQTGALPGTIMGQMGAQDRAITQEQLADKAQRYLASIQGNLPALQEYAALVGGAVPTSSQYAFRGSPITGALGGAASGAAVGSMFGPWGTAIGAGIGGIGGLMR